MSGLAQAVVVQDGQVVDVYEVRRGGVLGSTLAPGATTLVIDDADQFVDDGGFLSLSAQSDVLIAADPVAGTPAYWDLASSQGVAYTKVDRDTGVATLALPWDVGFPTFVPGDSVWIEPPSIDHRIDVALDGDPRQTVTAIVPHTLSAMLPDGTRQESEGEWVRVAVTASGYELVDVLNEQAFVSSEAVIDEDPTGTSGEFDVISANVVDSPSVPKRNGEAMTLYVSPTDPTASDDNGGEALSPMLDTFTRVNASAFGTSDSGHLWTNVQNQGNLREVDGASARVRLNGGSQTNVQRSAFAPLDVEVLTTLNLSTIPTGGGIYAGIGLRIVDSTRSIWAGLQCDSNGIIKPEFGLLINSVWSDSFEPNITLGTFTGPQLAAIDWRIRVQAMTNPDGGTDYRMRVWQSTAPEPDDWTIGDWNDVSAGGLQQAFGVGTSVRSGSAYTGAVITSWRDFVATTLDGSGESVDVTVGGVGPLATLAAALAKAGDWNDGVVTLILAGIIEEDLDVQGLCGGGKLVIDGGGATTLNGFVRFKNVAHDVLVRSLTVQDTGNPGPAASLDVYASGFVWFDTVVVQTNGYRTNVCRFEYGSRGRVDGCGLHNATSRGLYAANASIVYAFDNTGSISPTSYQASCATIFQNGSKPSNATNSTLGGQLLGSTSSNAGGSAPTPQPTKKTDTVTANSTKTWRPAWGYRDDDLVVQGEWQGSGGLSRGCAWYGSKLRRSGKTAVSGKVYVIRTGSGGMSGKQDVFLATHPHEAKPGGSPTIGNGPTRVGALGYNEGAYFTIPKGWVQDLITGGQRGLMLYHGTPSPYIICKGRSGNSNAMKVQITYQ